nr:SDR family oxidoreductase [Tetragenococcus muriaticus]
MAKNINVNLTAPFLMIKAALPFLRQTKGNIVNTGSVEGQASNPNHAAYSVTKAGIQGLTHSVTVDHRHEGIRCNAVAPSWIDTPLNINTIENSYDVETFKQKIGPFTLLDEVARLKKSRLLLLFWQLMKRVLLPDKSLQLMVEEQQN